MEKGSRHLGHCTKVCITFKYDPYYPYSLDRPDWPFTGMHICEKMWWKVNMPNSE
jgi:hypothetical protein